MKQCLTVFISTISFFAGCRQQQQWKARIFERRELEDHRLMIRYQYVLDGKTFTDSATMSNVVISSDTIPIIIDPANPGASIPDIK